MPGDDFRAVLLKAAAVLLDYPDEEGGDLELVRAAVEELPASAAHAELARFLSWYAALSPRQRQAEYVDIFELGGRHTLYLTAPGERDKRQRGRELLRLKDAYRRAGFEPMEGELPDYLPLVLEFAALAPEGARLLAGLRAPLRALADGLCDQFSPFSAVPRAVLSLLEES